VITMMVLLEAALRKQSDFVLFFYLLGYALDNLSTLCAVVCNRIILTFSVYWYSFMIKVSLEFYLCCEDLCFSQIIIWHILWLRKGSSYACMHAYLC